MIKILNIAFMYIYTFSPYVLMIWFVCELIRDVNRRDKLQREEEKACKERNRATYALAHELRVLNNRIEREMCAGEKKAEDKPEESEL